jgi:PPOX class probable F420-dependent enzyme
MIDPQHEDYVSLATFRKDGREVRTPVWIAGGDGGVWLYTKIDSGKAKRIRRNPRVRVASSDIRGKVRGDWMDATARIVQDAAKREQGIRAFVEKYGWQMRLAILVARLSGSFDERVIIELHF